MTKAGWRGRIDGALPWIVTISMAALGPQIVGNAFNDGSAWRWSLFVIWLFALLGGACSIYYGRKSSPTPIAPTDVAAEDVAAAIAATDSRIYAIKALRQEYPGLGLKAAVDLVDESLRGAA